MRKATNVAVKAVPGFVVTTMIVMATIPLSTAGSTIAGNLRWLGLTPPELLESGTADAWTVGAAVGLAVLWLAALWCTRDRPPEKVCDGPTERAAALREVVPLRDALSYWYFREWGRHDLDSLGRFIHYGNAATQFEAYARNNALTIWGATNQHNGTVAPIPADVWEEQLIDRTSALGSEPQTQYRSVEPTYKYRLYYALGANHKEVEELFKPLRFRRMRQWIRNLKSASTAF